MDAAEAQTLPAVDSTIDPSESLANAVQVSHPLVQKLHLQCPRSLAYREDENSKLIDFIRPDGLPVAPKDQTKLYATSKTACHTNLAFSRRSKSQINLVQRAQLRRIYWDWHTSLATGREISATTLRRSSPGLLAGPG